MKANSDIIMHPLQTFDRLHVCRWSVLSQPQRDFFSSLLEMYFLVVGEAPCCTHSIKEHPDGCSRPLRSRSDCPIQFSSIMSSCRIRPYVLVVAMLQHSLAYSASARLAIEEGRGPKKERCEENSHQLQKKKKCQKNPGFEPSRYGMILLCIERISRGTRTRLNGC